MSKLDVLSGFEQPTVWEGLEFAENVSLGKAECPLSYFESNDGSWSFQAVRLADDGHIMTNLGEIRDFFLARAEAGNFNGILKIPPLAACCVYYTYRFAVPVDFASVWQAIVHVWNVELLRSGIDEKVFTFELRGQDKDKVPEILISIQPVQ